MLKCDGQAATLHRLDKETGMTVEKGPVAMGDKKCSDLAKLDDKGLRGLSREGIWTGFYKESGRVMSEGEYRKNRREGVHKTLSENGSLEKSVMYANGVKEGEEIRYFAGSQEWKERGINRNDQRTGPWESRLTPGLECIAKGDYREGKRSGSWAECGLTESKKAYRSFEGSYVEDLKSGRGILFFDNGAKMGEGNYRADLECAKAPPPTGISECEKRMGGWIFYHSTGAKSMEGSYDGEKGKKVGRWIEYYATGAKLGEGMRDHTRTGTWTFFDKSGAVLGRFEFNHNDNFIKTGEIWENGRKVAEPLKAEGCKTVVNRLGKEVIQCEKDAGSFAAALMKYDAATDSIELKLKMQNGYWAEFDEAGRRVAEGRYTNGRREGPWKELQNGKWITLEYTMGKLK